MQNQGDITKALYLLVFVNMARKNVKKMSKE